MLPTALFGTGCNANPYKPSEEKNSSFKDFKMTIEYITTKCMSTIVLALSPSDRWAAAKDIQTGSSLPSWFMWSVGIALTILAASVLATIYKQRSQRVRRTK